MEEVFFTFDSVTYANKAKRILRGVGITTKLKKISSKNNGVGCLHGISVPGESYFDAVRALRESGIGYSVIKI